MAGVGESNLRCGVRVCPKLPARAEPKSDWDMLSYQMEVSKSQHMLFFVFFKHEEGVVACKVYHIRRYVFASWRYLSQSSYKDLKKNQSILSTRGHWFNALSGWWLARRITSGLMGPMLARSVDGHKFTGRKPFRSYNPLNRPWCLDVDMVRWSPSKIPDGVLYGFLDIQTWCQTCELN